MSQTIIKEMKGINATKAALQLQPGEMVSMQNVRTRPFYNWAKRKGVEHVSTSTDPIMGIFDFELDNIVIPIVQSGSTLTFFANTYVAGGSQPDPYDFDGRSSDDLDPNGYRTTLFLLEPVMRAVNERLGVVGLTGASWPNRAYNSDGTSANIAPATVPASTFYVGAAFNLSMPVNNFYQYDLAWYDISHGSPTGTRAAELVNLIIDALRNVVGYYINTNVGIEGQATITYWDTTTVGAPAAGSASASNYRQKLVACRQTISKLTSIVILASQADHSARQTLGINSGSGGCAGCQSAVDDHNASEVWGEQTQYNSDGGTIINAPFSNSTMAIVYYSQDSIAPGWVGSRNVKAKIQVDLTPYLTGAGFTFYFMLSANPGIGIGLSTYTLGQSRPTSGPADVYSQWTSQQTPVLGTISKSGFLSEAAGTPSPVPGTCPFSNASLGWRMTAAILQFYPQFVNP